MDLNEQLKGWLQQQAQPGSFLDKAGLGLARAGQTIGQDAAAGAAIMNDPRNSWIGMNPLGKAVSGGLGLAGALGQIVYHGSPHAFEKFALSKIGTGEGAQAYGHGLYFAENPKVAEGYAKVLPYKDFERKVAEVYGEFDHPDDAVAALAEAGLSPAQMKVMEALKKDDWLGFDYPHQALRAAMSKNAVEQYGVSKETAEAIKGLHNIYKVDLPDEKMGLMLDWEKPISQQSYGVKRALQDSGLTDELRKFYERTGSDPMQMTGGEFYRGLAETEAEASKRLMDAGIPGLRYLDGMSRKGGVGTSNFVVFDDQLPVIKEKGGLELVK